MMTPVAGAPNKEIDCLSVDKRLLSSFTDYTLGLAVCMRHSASNPSQLCLLIFLSASCKHSITPSLSGDRALQVTLVVSLTVTFSSITPATVTITCRHRPLRQKDSGSQRYHWHHHPWLTIKVKLHPQGIPAPSTIQFGIDSARPLLAHESTDQLENEDSQPSLALWRTFTK